jgi:uncharacterized protein
MVFVVEQTLGGTKESVLAWERSIWEMADEAFRDYRKGSFLEIMAQRAQERTFLYYSALYMVPAILAMFLLGLWAGKVRLFHKLAENLGFFRRVLFWGLAIGLPANLIYVVGFQIAGMIELTLLGALSLAAFMIGGPALCFAYISAIILLVRREFWRKRLALLAPVGRMALTNYLFQSIICTTIFYSYGLGLYGTVGPVAGFFLAVVIYLMQIPLSVWWLKRFRFGPMEWLWRSATYGGRQPLRIPEEKGMSEGR